MININTILSTFDERGTLLKWLKTTNDALKNASLKSVEAVQPTATTLQLKFIFADDSSLLSPPITLPKGEQGDPGKDATLPGYINFFNGQLVSTSYDTNEFNFKAPFEMKASETGEVLKTGDFNFKILIGGSDFIAVDLDESDSFLQIKLDETKVDTAVNEGSTNLITSGGAFKNDPLFFKTDNMLDSLTEEETSEFDLIIKKSLAEKRPIIVRDTESYNYLIYSNYDSIIHFYTTSDAIDGVIVYQFRLIDNKWKFDLYTLFSFYQDVSWSFTEEKEYTFYFSRVSRVELFDDNKLAIEKMSLIFDDWKMGDITNLTISFGGKSYNIIEITFSNQTDYTFYYLENGVVKNVVIDASIIQ